ncbi:transposase [Streptomyces sp. NPDC057963]|uniref:transposase n=1 Tax=Streptomyces sp. NPDC057963 TaxID=3346290 RepID=UPI0036E3F1F0
MFSDGKLCLSHRIGSTISHRFPLTRSKHGSTPSINAETLRNWIRAAGSGQPRGRRSTAPSSAPVVPSALEAEVAALRRENAELKKEREILRKAARYLTAETGW